MTQPRTLQERLEWRCFNCDAVFTEREKAKEHFGEYDGDVPTCRMTNYDVYALRLSRDGFAKKAEDADRDADHLKAENSRLRSALEAQSALLEEAERALEAMRFHFGNPKRDEWLNDQAFENAKGADTNARAVLAKLKARKIGEG